MTLVEKVTAFATNDLEQELKRMINGKANVLDGIAIQALKVATKNHVSWIKDVLNVLLHKQV